MIFDNLITNSIWTIRKKNIYYFFFNHGALVLVAEIGGIVPVHVHHALSLYLSSPVTIPRRLLTVHFRAFFPFGSIPGAFYTCRFFQTDFNKPYRQTGLIPSLSFPAAALFPSSLYVTTQRRLFTLLRHWC